MIPHNSFVFLLCAYEWSICICVYILVYVQAYMWGVHVYMKARVWSWESSSVTLNLIYWGKVFELSPELINLTSLASQPSLGISCFCLPSAGIPDRPPMPNGIYVGSGHPNFSPHVCCYSDKCFNHWELLRTRELALKFAWQLVMLSVFSCLLDILCFLLKNVCSKTAHF